MINLKFLHLLSSKLWESWLALGMLGFMLLLVQLYMGLTLRGRKLISMSYKSYLSHTVIKLNPDTSQRLVYAGEQLAMSSSNTNQEVFC